MRKKINPVIASLIYDALLKCFWRKEALKRFLRSSGIAGSFLAQLDANETKRIWLDRLFPLVTEHEKGVDVLLGMAKALASLSTFPDLEGWEDSVQKIAAAKDAVAALAQAMNLEDEKNARERAAKDSRDKGEAIRKVAIREQADLAALNQRIAARLEGSTGACALQGIAPDGPDMWDAEESRAMLLGQWRIAERCFWLEADAVH
jgi:hypothetical protein